MWSGQQKDAKNKDQDKNESNKIREPNWACTDVIFA